MNAKSTNEFDLENEELLMVNPTDDDPKEQPKPDEDDGSVGTGEENEDEGVIKPYN